MDTASVFSGISDYIAQFPATTQEKLNTMYRIIKETAPNAGEKIAYGMPTFTYPRNLVHFAGYKNHIGFYPSPSGIRAFAEELSGFVTSKGAIQFPLDREIPEDLVRKIVVFRMEEELQRLKK